MKKKRLLIFAMITLFITGYLYNNFLVKFSIVGTYVNTNFKYPPFVAEIPYQPDTLILLENSTFLSAYFGKGNYKLSYSTSGTEIELIQKDSSFHTIIKRRFFGAPQIILVEDHDHYYRKIK